MAKVAQQEVDANREDQQTEEQGGDPAARV